MINNAKGMRCIEILTNPDSGKFVNKHLKSSEYLYIICDEKFNMKQWYNKMLG